MAEFKTNITADGLYQIGEGKSIAVLTIQTIGTYDLGGGTLTLQKWVSGDLDDINSYQTVASVDLSTAPDVEYKNNGGPMALYLTGATNPDINVRAASAVYYQAAG